MKLITTIYSIFHFTVKKKTAVSVRIHTFALFYYHFMLSLILIKHTYRYILICTKHITIFYFISLNFFV